MPICPVECPANIFSPTTRGNSSFHARTTSSIWRGTAVSPAYRPWKIRMPSALHGGVRVIDASEDRVPAT